MKTFKSKGIVQKFWFDSVTKTWSFMVLSNEKSKKDYISDKFIYTTSYKELNEAKEYAKSLNYLINNESESII